MDKNRLEELANEIIYLSQYQRILSNLIRDCGTNLLKQSHLSDAHNLTSFKSDCVELSKALKDCNDDTRKELNRIYKEVVRLFNEV